MPIKPMSGYLPGGPGETSQREVELRIIFLRVGEIDTLNEKFYAEILVEARWEEPRLCSEFSEQKQREEKDFVTPSKFWNPKIYIENALNDPSQAVHYKIKKEVRVESATSSSSSSTSRVRTSSESTDRFSVDRSLINEPAHLNEFINVQFKYWIYEYRKLRGYFFEKLELEYFPVDIQSMSIMVTSYRSNKEVRLVPNKRRKSIVNSKVNIDNNIW